MANRDPEEAGLELNEDDEIVEVIELGDDDFTIEEGLQEEMGDMDLENDDDDDSDDEGGDDADDTGEMEAAGGDGDFKDDADLVFSKHKESVFCVNVDPKTCDLAVSGGQDDTAFVWSMSSGEVILECTGYKDSVTCADFSHDGVYVATADLSGIVKVWKVESREEIWSFECSDVEWLRWHHSAHVLIVGTVDGDLWMWKIPSGECRTFQGHGCTATCGNIMPDGKRVCVGYDDGLVKLWDLKTSSVLQQTSGMDAHNGSVISIDAHRDNTMVISGSTDITAKLINSNTGKVVGCLDCSKKSHDTSSTDTVEEDSVEAVGFSVVQNYIATGSLTGSLVIWDMATLTARHCCRHDGGIVKLRWDPSSSLVYTCCLDGVVRLWDARDGKNVSQWSGHAEAILDFDISRDGNTLVSVSEDKTARVYSLSMPDR